MMSVDNSVIRKVNLIEGPFNDAAMEIAFWIDGSEKTITARVVYSSKNLANFGKVGMQGRLPSYNSNTPWE
jgi:hypothetical protein